MESKGAELRSFKRGQLQIGIRYTMQKKSKKGYMTNLSEGGCLMYCHSSEPVQLNEPVEISFSLKNSMDTIKVKGKVVRVMPFERSAQDVNYALGIEFLTIKEAQKKAIANFTRQFLADTLQE
jgi:c-di-GMP-binding flagellar brake protein YcgR